MFFSFLFVLVATVSLAFLNQYILDYIFCVFAVLTNICVMNYGVVTYIVGFVMFL